MRQICTHAVSFNASKSVSIFTPPFSANPKVYRYCILPFDTVSYDLESIVLHVAVRGDLPHITTISGAHSLKRALVPHRDRCEMSLPDKSAPPAEAEDFAYAIQVDGEPMREPVGPDYDRGKPEPVSIKVGAWDADFCGCTRHCVPNCCMAWCCPCVSLAQISVRLGIAPYECAVATLALIIIGTFGLGHLVLFVWIWQARYITRDRFKIPGDCCGDCCAALLCPCCTLAQIATHIKSYTPGRCDFGPPDTLPPYQFD